MLHNKKKYCAPIHILNPKPVNMYEDIYKAKYLHLKASIQERSTCRTHYCSWRNNNLQPASSYYIRTHIDIRYNQKASTSVKNMRTVLKNLQVPQAFTQHSMQKEVEGYVMHVMEPSFVANQTHFADVAFTVQQDTSP